jgi:predicted membrane protein
MKKHKFTIEKTPEQERNSFRAKMLTGFFVIAFGVLILLNQMNIDFPSILLSWKLIIMMVGLVSLVKHNFKNTTGYVLVLIGALFLFNDFYPYTIQTRFIWPILIIVFGISIFIKALRSKKKESKFTEYTILSEEKSEMKNDENYINSTAFFGGVTKNVVTKNFKGATISSIFGGTELNFTHADFENKVVVDVTAIFGGINIIVPSNWKIQSEITSVFGGIDDARKASMLNQDENKLLILKGNCVFGGVEISSYA